MRVLLISADPKARETFGLAVRSIERKLGDGERIEFLEAADGVAGLALAWRERPDIVVADEITSRAGAFAVARDLTQAAPPLGKPIVVLLERAQDAWLAQWSGADAWFVKPVNPFDLADTVGRLLRSEVEPV